VTPQIVLCVITNLLAYVIASEAKQSISKGIGEFHVAIEVDGISHSFKKRDEKRESYRILNKRLLRHFVPRNDNKKRQRVTNTNHMNEYINLHSLKLFAKISTFL